MGKIIAVVNQKGGVGKTTTAVNLTAALTEAGKKVLLCDFDPQANATSGMGIEKRKLKASVYDVVINQTPVAQVIRQTKYGSVLPSAADLAGAAVELLSMPEPSHQLAGALDTFKSFSSVGFVKLPSKVHCGVLNPLCSNCMQKLVNRSKQKFNSSSFLFLPITRRISRNSSSEGIFKVLLLSPNFFSIGTSFCNTSSEAGS